MCKKFFVIFVFLTSAAYAGIKLPAIISDNMVLQADMNVPIWGTVLPNRKINITCSWSQEKFTVAADANGRWMTKIHTPKSGRDCTIKLTCGKAHKEIKNILIGQVWLCSGQSNMRWYVKDSENADREISQANYPDIRLFVEQMIDADNPAEDCNGRWMVCSPETVGRFSAAGYFFGRELHNKLNVPIGLINASRGGTTAQAWIAKDVLAADSELKNYLEQDVAIEAKRPQYEKLYQLKLDEWKKRADIYKSQGMAIPQKPNRPRELLEMRRPSRFYNSMIHPLIPFAIKGVIWYQGEGNVNDARSYKKLFSTVISSWRKEWRQGDFPFYYAQLSCLRKCLKQPDDPVPTDCNLALLREAQFQSLSVPNTGMVVTIDIGESGIHPRNKQDVGKRFALLALAKNYGYKDIVCSGPLYKSMKVEGSRIRISFDSVGSGLMVKGDTLKGFTIGGSDGKFVWADAKIEGDTVLVWSNSVAQPTAARYGWADWMECGLYNRDGLPASPFRTDN
jgi:sialate O-acetylesterase